MQISAYNRFMRRRSGTLLPIEIAILDTAVRLRVGRNEAFHGFMMAQELRARGDQRDLAGHGTLYRALARLEAFGYLSSRWESSTQPIREHRPIRRLYSLTAEGEAALATIPRALRTVPHFALEPSAL